MNSGSTTHFFYNIGKTRFGDGVDFSLMADADIVKAELPELLLGRVETVAAEHDGLDVSDRILRSYSAIIFSYSTVVVCLSRPPL